MSGTLTYHDLLAAVSIRVNALEGTDPVELQVSYSTRPLIDEMFDSSIFPMNAIRDAIIEAEGKMAGAIALSGNRTLRAQLRAVSDPLASGAALPTDVTGLLTARPPIIGNLGAVLDGDDGTLCTPQPVAVVRNRLLSPLIYLAPAYYFAIDGATIIHTRTTVTLECCVYDATVQTNLFDANDPILLPDALAEAYINGAIAILVRDDEFVQQASQAANYFTAFLGTLPPAQMEATAF